MERGVLLLAMGHPFYGKMAFNLAVSIKAADPDVSVALCYSGDGISHYTEQMKSLFSHLKEIPAECYGYSNNWMMAKTRVYDLSPFEKTIYLDADVIWFNRRAISEMFNQLQGHIFTMANHGHRDLNNITDEKKSVQWLSLEKVKEKYGSEGKYYTSHSEFIYFEKCEANAVYFAKVKEVFKDMEQSDSTLPVMKFATSIPDEPAYSIAGMLLQHYPHADNFLPAFWQPYHANVPAMEKMFDQYYMLSMGGNQNSKHINTLYNKLCEIAFQRMGLRYPWKAQDKKLWLPERKKI